LLIACLAAAAAAPLSAQDTFSFQAETARLRGLVESSPDNTRQKHDLFVELAELFRLSGDNEQAAAAWKDAAFTLSGARDDRALLESAACLMAIGEWAEAQAAVHLVILTGANTGELMLRAKFLAAQIEAFTRGDTTALTYYLTDPGYAALKPSLYYTLYIITKDETYKTSLITEFPASPETRLVTDDTMPFPGAMWLLYPGREGIVIQR
jgi:hypothetical protein